MRREMLRRALLWAVLEVGAFTGVAMAQERGLPDSRLVVVLYPQNSDGRPGNTMVDQGIRTTLSRSPAAVEVINEYLDIREPRDGKSEQLQQEYLRQKYVNRNVDVVIAGLSPSLDWILRNQHVFPDVPVVFCAVDHQEVKARQLPPQFVGIPASFDLEATLRLALALHPRADNLAVITGCSEMDLDWQRRAKEAFQPYASRLNLRYLAGLTMDEIRSAVESLPRNSIVYYVHMFQDREGRAWIPAQALKEISGFCPVPIYGHVDTYVGSGIVGGKVFSFSAEGRNAAGLALRLMDGESPAQIGVQVPATNDNYMFDAAQLKRWRISSSQLPQGSEVLSQGPDFWKEYGWTFVGGGLVCALQAFLLVYVAIQGRRRLRAEARFKQAVEAAPNGMLMIGRDGRIVMANRQLEVMFGYSRDELLGQSVECLIPEESRAVHARLSEAFLRAPSARSMGAGRELHGVRRDGSRFDIEVGLSPVKSEVGPVVFASVMDISGRRLAEAGLRNSERQLRQLANGLIEVQEMERRRLARELHDDISQQMALLSVETDVMRSTQPDFTEEQSVRLQGLSSRIRQLSSSIHELSHELHPLKLEQLGLVTAVRGLCREVSQAHQLTIDFVSAGVHEPLPPDAALCLYRITQEALRNVVKHSGAGRATVTLRASEDQVSLMIEDQGVGPDVSATEEQPGLGLLSMRERARLVGGTFSIRPAVAGGTSVEVRIPLDQARSPSGQSVEPAEVVIRQPVSPDPLEPQLRGGLP